MLSQNVGNRLNRYVSDYVIFDLETTGTSVVSDAVVEISALKVQQGRVTDEFSTLVDPERPIPYWAGSINGITDEMVQNSPKFREALKDFLDFAGNAVLAGHNIQSFDLKIINRDALRYWGKNVGNDFIDTLSLSRMYLPELEHHTLTDLAEHYHIPAAGAHRALNDCRMNQQIFECLGREIQNASSKGLNVCPRCGLLLKKRKGRYGEFWGCTGYPECRFTRNISVRENT